jgi:hypothetical protein
MAPHCGKLCGLMSLVGHQEPLILTAAAAGLASIADVGGASRLSRSTSFPR